MSQAPQGPKRRPSGNIAAQAYREKYASVAEGTLPLVQDLNARIDRLTAAARTPIPPPIKREEEDDPVDTKPDSEPDTLPETGATRRTIPGPPPSPRAKLASKKDPSR